MLKIVLATAAVVIASVSTAAAHPGSPILTTGKGERTAMTPGVKFEEVKGVHLFKGRAAAKPATPKRIVMRRIEKRVIIGSGGCSCPPHHLRAQGFWSGAGSSHSYAHGFYSDFGR